MLISSRIQILLFSSLVLILCACSDGSGGSGGPAVPATTVDLTLAVGEQDTQTLTVTLPTTDEIGADIMVLFDRSGSLGDDRETFIMESGEIVDALASSLPDLRIGLGSFVDAPCSDFGDLDQGDFGYELNLPLSGGGTNRVTRRFRNALLDLDIKVGGDRPEAQLEAIRQALTGDGLVVDATAFPDCAGVADIAPSDPGFESDRLRFLIVATDDSFHLPTDDGYPYPTSVADVIELALEQGVTIFFLDSGGLTDMVADEIALATRGDVFELSAASEEVVAAVDDALSTAIGEVEVRVEPIGMGAEFVTDIQPMIQVLDLLSDRDAAFDVTFSNDLEVSESDRDFFVDFVFSVDGAEISRQRAEIFVPGTVAP